MEAQLKLAKLQATEKVQWNFDVMNRYSIRVVLNFFFLVPFIIYTDIHVTDVYYIFLL